MVTTAWEFPILSGGRQTPFKAANRKSHWKVKLRIHNVERIHLFACNVKPLEDLDRVYTARVIDGDVMFKRANDLEIIPKMASLYF